MSRGWSVPAAALIAAAAASITAAAPVPKDAAYKAGKENANTLVRKHKPRLAVAASTEWQGYPVGNLFDGSPESAWYSNSGDAPMNGTAPWVRATFPEDVVVNRVTVLGNRDPQFPTGYGVLAGKIELLDKDGKVVRTRELKAGGEKLDFDWVLDRPAGARAVRFTATEDQKQFGCVGLAEVMVE